MKDFYLGMAYGLTIGGVAVGFYSVFAAWVCSK